MKSAIFKKTYVTDTVFDASDFAELISQNGNGLTIVNRQQLDNLFALDKNGNLSMYLQQNNYRLTYFGNDKSNNHIFKIENGINELELSMTDTYFRIAFSTE